MLCFLPVGCWPNELGIFEGNYPLLRYKKFSDHIWIRQWERGCGYVTEPIHFWETQPSYSYVHRSGGGVWRWGYQWLHGSYFCLLIMRNTFPGVQKGRMLGAYGNHDSGSVMIQWDAVSDWIIPSPVVYLLSPKNYDCTLYGKDICQCNWAKDLNSWGLH